jgi:hypothetical protein
MGVRSVKWIGPIALFIRLAWAGCGALALDQPANETQLLNDTFRIDIDTITVQLTYHPDQSSVDGEATVVFRMRPGQRRPLIHFDPATRADGGQVISFLCLDGEALGWSDGTAVKVIEFSGSTQKAIEFQRDLSANLTHTLLMRYRLTRPAGYPRFSTEVNDYVGRGNEEIFPTLNTPAELARHLITLRVDGRVSYRCLGSGLVRKLPGTPQSWFLDTEREVASYTVMFALLPESDTVWEERTIAGIPVRIMAFKGGASPAVAFAKLDTWLPQITAEIGPFPMPRGLSIFLVSLGGGMEYFGGTISSNWALRHEVFHMYFGCSTVARTYRDSWWDEAITSWYEKTYTDIFVPMDPNYRSNMVSGRSPTAVGFDIRAYREGAQIIEAMAVRAGGREALTRFLSHVYRTYAFAPFGTMDLAEYFRQSTGADMKSQFINWLYMGQASGPARAAGSLMSAKKPDLTPPRPILRKYRLDRDKRHWLEK